MLSRWLPDDPLGHKSFRTTDNLIQLLRMLCSSGHERCSPRVSIRSPANHSSGLPSGLRGWSYTLKRSAMSLTLTLPELLISKSHDVKMYPIDPCNDGKALIEYEVLNSGLGDLEIANFSPVGTSKSNIARAKSVRIPKAQCLDIDDHIPVDERVM